jgi:pyrimidine deaminase RibD-like protein
VSFDDFKMKPSSDEWKLSVLREAYSARRLCVLTETSGEKLYATLTAAPSSDPDAKIDVCDLRGSRYSLKLSALKAVEFAAIQSESDYMQTAIEESSRCINEEVRDPLAPLKVTPLVGAVLVRDGVQIASARRGEHQPGEHAEFTLLEKKLSGRKNAGAILFTTLEPCTKRGPGKTPCVEWIIQHRIGRVVIGVLDPNKDICGEGFYRLRESGIEVGFCDPVQMAQIEQINRQFIAYHRNLPKT